uniref:B30.2/SPRY domain-containing protein n=1 Tax=Amorphochlora amoebiformis TaxID=1561963 RepID=A0A7S0DTT3_9EUKA|mmetsp:Transcript_6492/g.9989  ORF Transcript_6492/g.9989 Transcript_6492/m.9989 type:complete len:387 (+) Transcript_6492:26-1186(+)
MAATASGPDSHGPRVTLETPCAQFVAILEGNYVGTAAGRTEMLENKVTVAKLVDMSAGEWKTSVPSDVTRLHVQRFLRGNGFKLKADEASEEAPVKKRRSNSHNEFYVSTPMGFGRFEGDRSGISKVSMSWGTQYLKNEKVERKVNIKVVTFYRGGTDMKFKLRPDQTAEHVRSAIGKKINCPAEEIRLALKGNELTGKELRQPIALLPLPMHQPFKMLFVHETRYKFFLDRRLAGKHLSFSSNLLSVTLPKHSGDQTVRGNSILSKGRLYWDVHIDRSLNGRINLGVCVDGHSSVSFVGHDAQGWAYYGNNGKREHNGSSERYGPTYGTGDTVRVKLDMDKRTLGFQKNSLDLGIAFRNLPNKVYPAFTLYQPGDKITLKTFGTF